MLDTERKVIFNEPVKKEAPHMLIAYKGNIRGFREWLKGVQIASQIVKLSNG